MHQPNTDPSNSQTTLPWSRVLVLALIYFGISVTEGVSAQLLPLTLRRFTEDAFLIGLILALNPLFGFLAQPLIGLWSDRVWTRLGRRAVFLIVAAPVVALCLILLPASRTLWHVVVLVALYQLFQDVLFGSDHPLLADLVPANRRSWVAGCCTVAAHAAGIFVGRIGLTLVQAHEQAHGGVNFGAPLYWWAAGFQVVFVAGLAFFLGERPPQNPPSQLPTLRQYAAELLARPALRQLAIINALRGFQGVPAAGFAVLFATTTLGLAKDHYGQIIGTLPFLGLLLSAPLGWLADHLPRHRVLQAAFVGAALGFTVGWACGGATGLACALGLGVIFGSLIEVAFKAHITEFYPPNRVGQLSGAMNACFGAGRALGFVLVGWLISATGGNYRLIWPVAALIALVNAFLLWRQSAPPTHDRS